MPFFPARPAIVPSQLWAQRTIGVIYTGVNLGYTNFTNVWSHTSILLHIFTTWRVVNHTHTHTHTHTYTYMHTYTHIHTYIRIYAYIYMCVCYTRIHTYIYIYIYISSSATTCPFVDFVVLPPGHGRSVTDFWGWDAHEAQLRCSDGVWVVIEEDVVPGGDIYIYIYVCMYVCMYYNSRVAINYDSRLCVVYTKWKWRIETN